MFINNYLLCLPAGLNKDLIFMKTKTEQTLAILYVVAWVVFIGLLIKAGAILISYGVSIVNPEGARNLYTGLNLYKIRQFDFRFYSATVSLLTAMSALKAYAAYLVINVLSKIKMENPFTVSVSKALDKISYIIVDLWIVAMVYNGYMSWLSKRIEGLERNEVSVEFILLGGVVFVFSQLFKRGVELQAENELTI